MRAYVLIVFYFAIWACLSAQNNYYVSYDANPGNPTSFSGWTNVIPLADHGAIVLAGPVEKVVARVDAGMTIQWASQLNLPGSVTTYFVYDMVLTNDSNIVVVGYGGTNLRETILVKFDLDGNVLWQKSLESHFQVCGFYVTGVTMVAGYDNGFLLVGFNSNDNTMAMRFDVNGNLLWAEQYEINNYTGLEGANDVVQIGNNEYMILSRGRSMSYLRIADAGGALLAYHHFQIGTGSGILPEFIARGSNGDLFVLGNLTDSLSGDMFHWLVRLTTSGNLVWAKTYHDPALSLERQEALLITPTDEIITVGRWDVVGSANRRTMITRFDAAGNHLGSMVGNHTGYERIADVAMLDGDLLLGISSLTDRNVLARVDADGSGFCSEVTANVVVQDILPSITSLQEQMTTTHIPTVPVNTTWTISPKTYVRTVLCGVVGVDPATIEDGCMLSPNPATAQFTLQHPAVEGAQVTLTDLSGRKLYTLVPDASAQSTTFDISDLAAGMYIIQWHGAGRVVNLRLVVE